MPLWRRKLNSWILRLQEELFRWAFFYDFALFHENDTVGNLTRELHFVGNNNHCHALSRQFADDVKNLTDAFWIKGGRDFVEKDYGRRL